MKTIVLKRFLSANLYVIGWQAILLAFALTVELEAARAVYQWSKSYTPEIASVWLFLISFIVVAPPVAAITALLLFPSLSKEGRDANTTVAP